MKSKFIGRKVAGSLLLAAAGTLGMTATASAQDTLKIAIMEPLSGPMASSGEPGVRHMNYIAEHFNKNGGILGKKIEIVPFDNKLSPQESLVILRQIADQGIQYVIQGQGSHIAGALISALERHNQRNDNKILYFNYAAVDPTLTEAQCSFWHFRFDANSEMKLEALTTYMANTPEVKKVFLINQDYAHGHQISSIAKRQLGQKDPSIQIVGDVLHPIARVRDFSPYITQIRASGADSVITGNWGNDLALLIKAAADNGLKVNFYTYYGGGVGVPKALGAAGEGHLFQISEYHGNLPTERGTEALYDFIKPYDALTNGESNWYFQRLYTLTETLKNSIERAGSTDPTQVAFAMEGIDVDTPYGPAVMRGIDHQLQQPLFISVFTKDSKYDVENTGMGFKTIAEMSAEDASSPTSCVMKRPRR